jgi:hypothetical protein
VQEWEVLMPETPAAPVQENRTRLSALPCPP